MDLKLSLIWLFFEPIFLFLFYLKINSSLFHKERGFQDYDGEGGGRESLHPFCYP